MIINTQRFVSHCSDFETSQHAHEKTLRRSKLRCVDTSKENRHQSPFPTRAPCVSHSNCSANDRGIPVSLMTLQAVPEKWILMTKNRHVPTILNGSPLLKKYPPVIKHDNGKWTMYCIYIYIGDFPIKTSIHRGFSSHV